jgi:hypothetical protein
VHTGTAACAPTVDKCLRLCESPALGELRRGEEGLHLGLKRRRRLACDAGLALVLAFQLHHAIAGEGRVGSELFEQNSEDFQIQKKEST